jgi:hypothetical protein
MIEQFFGIGLQSLLNATHRFIDVACKSLRLAKQT